MCQLALMNANILQICSLQDLADLFAQLEKALGGHGNGCAALWQKTERVKISKGMHVTTSASAKYLVTAAQAGADWLVFHTRLASCERQISQNCHPFQAGKVTLAHNGHDRVWANLGSHLGITDSECITRMWGRIPLPIESLQEADGVFVGFHGSRPFVVKGQSYRNLVLAVNHEVGALLFVSHLPQAYRTRFDEVIEIGRFTWLGATPLDLRAIPRCRQYGYPSRRKTSSRGATPLEESLLPAVDHMRTEAAEFTIEELRAYIAKMESRRKGSTSVPSNPGE